MSEYFDTHNKKVKEGKNEKETEKKKKVLISYCPNSILISLLHIKNLSILCHYFRYIKNFDD